MLTRFSRLLIDANRGEDDPTLVMRLSDGAVVPGNAAVDAAERERRLARFYRPYHAAIVRLIDAMLATRQAARDPLDPFLHAGLEGRRRPWHAGILWDRDPRFAAAAARGAARRARASASATTSPIWAR